MNFPGSGHLDLVQKWRWRALAKAQDAGWDRTALWDYSSGADDLAGGGPWGREQGCTAPGSHCMVEVDVTDAAGGAAAGVPGEAGKSVDSVAPG
jgi:hypothetical protein